MSLLDQYERDCTILVPEKTNSDEGGYVTAWKDGEKFKARLARGSSSTGGGFSDTTRGEQEGYVATFNVLVDRDLDIKYGDYFRDDLGGGVFLVTTEPDMSQAPKSASFSLKNFTAKREDAP